ncbi:ATP-binding protein [Pseudomonas entomophila]|uniref:ATP-binding protein n=1 Tax=Pseudomonas entomophila TaxID=312306 RepID=UPI0015E2E417|nr:ATP-binding protein [Pseudomonas entomophila]MBA1189246.1 ATP-binding protein [Pseudomonas entomophila]
MIISASLTQVLPIDDDSQVGHARRSVQRLAEQQGFDEVNAGRAALVATELATNLIKHAGQGVLHVRTLPGPSGNGLELLAIDRGQGFDADLCMADGYSTCGTQGLGLGSISRLTQVCDHYSDARGTVVLARLYPRAGTCVDLRFGVSQHSLHDDPACGDTWALAMTEQGVAALVIDGLGHGEDAEAAAHAGAAVFEATPFADLQGAIAAMHQAMLGTRGGAVALARYERARRHFSFAGIGNISASLVEGTRAQGLASHPGIVGGHYRKVQVFDYAEPSARWLILHSDGLQSRWNLNDYPGLVHCHPAVIAAVLHRDFCRGRDDVTVVVIDLESPHG